jgi:hypothetical protein
VEAQEAGRIAFAKTVENQMLDQGFNFDVVTHTHGAHDENRKIRWSCLFGSLEV